MRSIVIAALLAGCTSLNPVTLMRLNALDPLTVDPADLAVKLQLSEGLEIAPGTARLIWGGVRRDTGQTMQDSFVLVAQGDIFYVAPADMARLSAAQAQMAAWKQAAPDDTSGSLGVMLSPCTTGDGPGPDPRADVAIRMTNQGPFLILVRHGPIASVVSAQELQALDPCP